MKKYIVIMTLMILPLIATIVTANPCMDCDDTDDGVIYEEIECWIKTILVDGNKTHVHVDETPLLGSEHYIFYKVSPEHYHELDEAEDEDKKIELSYRVENGKCYINYIDNIEDDFIGYFVVFMIGFFVGMFFIVICLSAL